MTNRSIKEEPEAPPDLEELLVESKSRELEAQLRGWGIDFEKYKASAGQAGAEARTEFERQAQSLRAQMVRAQAKLYKLKKAGADASREMIESVDAAWDDLRKAFEDAAARFR